VVNGNDVKYDLPHSGVNLEGWMVLNAEFLTLSLASEDD